VPFPPSARRKGATIAAGSRQLYTNTLTHCFPEAL